MISILMAVGFGGVPFFLLKTQRQNAQKNGDSRTKFIFRLLSVIWGGAFPLALMGAEVFDRNGVAVLISIFNFVYFCLAKLD